MSGGQGGPEPDRRQEGTYLNRYVTGEQRSMGDFRALARPVSVQIRACARPFQNRQLRDGATEPGWDLKHQCTVS
ncbi:MAG: hypothetical protein JO313_04395 [Verrucomicrobia bacterium]|nr:hypothetical protein [Verrucomicrobiota bacterium]